jgi:hypothetical protein
MSRMLPLAKLDRSFTPASRPWPGQGVPVVRQQHSTACQLVHVRPHCLMLPNATQQVSRLTT